MRWKWVFGIAAVLIFIPVTGPFGLLVPFVKLGAHEKHPCDVEKVIKKVGK